MGLIRQSSTNLLLVGCEINDLSRAHDKAGALEIGYFLCRVALNCQQICAAPFCNIS